jgi:hypothetical protein
LSSVMRGAIVTCSALHWIFGFSSMLWLKSGAILFVWIFMIFDKVVTKNRVVNDYNETHE